MKNTKKLMAEIAVLYYEKNYTQQEIAKMMNLTRQTVSKLLNDAISEKIVEITIHNPVSDCKKLEEKLCEAFRLKSAVVCGVSSNNEALRRLMTVKAAVNHLMPIIKSGNRNIAVSWGRTIQSLIEEFPSVHTSGNVVFPLFGATDQEKSFFSSNELARSFSDKIEAKVKYAWFPYYPDNAADGELLKKTVYYSKMDNLWNNIDIAIVGIGNAEIIQTFGKIFGYNKKSTLAVGDISTHFFDYEGNFINLYENTLCASKDNIKNAAQTVAVASGDDKSEAITGALRTGIIDTIIMDEYTARKILCCDVN